MSETQLYQVKLEQLQGASVKIHRFPHTFATSQADAMEQLTNDVTWKGWTAVSAKLYERQPAVDAVGGGSGGEESREPTPREDT